MRFYDAILILGPFLPCLVLVTYGPLNLHTVFYFSIAWSHDPFHWLPLEVWYLRCFGIIHVLDSDMDGCFSAIFNWKYIFFMAYISM